MEYNTVGEWLGLIGMIGFYVWIKWMVYSREYKGDKDNQKDKCIKRGSEWD